jgi:succinyl-CoA:acetate CoA-transferase
LIMERVSESLKSKVMSAEQAAQFIQTGMVVAVSGFTSVGYPKEVPHALAVSGHAKDLSLYMGAAVGDEIDGELVRAGLVKRRYAHQSSKDLRNAINNSTIAYSDVHLSHFPMHMNQKTGPKTDIAIIECTAVTEDGLYLAASIGTSDAAVRTADKVIIEVNQTLPEGLIGMHDVFEIGLPPDAKIIPITSPSDRIGTPYIPCDPDKIVAIVMTNKEEKAQTFNPISPVMLKIGENVVDFLKGEIEAGRLPENPGPIQSGVGSVGNAVLSCLATSGFKGLSMYTEVMQDAALELVENGIFDFISSSSIALAEESRKRFYDNIDFFRDKMVIRPQEITNHPEVIRRLGLIALNTPIELDIYGNVNSTHIMGTKMMNGIGGSGDFTRNARINIFATESVAKGGLISCIVPMVSHVDHTEHDVAVIVTEQGIADLRWKTPNERAKLIIENCAHPDYKPMLREYYAHAYEISDGKHTPHDLEQCLSWHKRFLDTGTMKK